VWDKLDGLYGAQSRASTMQIWMKLATLKKQDLSATDYSNRVKHLTNTVAAIGATLRDDEVVAYLLTDLPEEFDSLVTSVTARADPMSLSEVYTNLLSFEMRLVNRHVTPSLVHAPEARYASCGGCGNHNGGHSSGCNGGRSRGHNTNNDYHNNDCSHCQICGCANHLAPQCWYHYDDDYQKEE
jgi:hypothetical protein